MSANTSQQQITRLLNDLIGAFWSASVQHQTHLALLQAQGLDALASQMANHISDEPQTIKALTDRLLDLDGTPDFPLASPPIATTLQAILTTDLRSQEAGLPVLNQAITTLAQQHDATTRRLLEDILAGEEAHLAWLRNEQALLTRMGEALYVSLRAGAATPAIVA